MIAADALLESGITAWEAEDAGEALEVLDQHPAIEVLFTDVNMPGEMDGLALASEVSATRPDVKVVVTSAATAVRKEDLPANGTFLPKPYGAEQLVKIVADKLNR
jgi:DNA-binding NtrC family response regulator